jgi:type VII secretion protein EccE
VVQPPAAQPYAAHPAAQPYAAHPAAQPYAPTAQPTSADRSAGRGRDRAAERVAARAAARAQPRIPARYQAAPARPSALAVAVRAIRRGLSASPPEPTSRRRSRGIGSIGRGRLLCWELAGATLIASIGRPRTVAIAAIAAVACAVAATTVRIRGRLLYQWLGRAGRYLLRPHQTHLVAGEHAAEDLVGQLADRPSVETIDLDGIPVAFIHQSDGIATVLELQIPDPDGDAAWAARTSVASLLPSPDPDAPPFAAKLIMQTASRLTSGARSPDAGRPVWITVQVLRTADIHAEADLSLALANAVQRLIRRLAREEVPTRTFDREETLSLVSALAHLDNSHSSEPLRLGESWAAWHAGGAVHACFGVRHWHDVDEAVRLQVLRRLHLIPSRGTTIAIAARRADWRTSGRATGQVVVRITESDRARLENSASLLAFAFDDLPEDIGVERLDGDQAGAVAGSLPLNAQAAAR